jgi:hypothetical protein
MQGGFSDDYITPFKSHSKYRERSGLIPVTAKIFNNLEIRNDDTLEYKEVQITDIVIVGYITEYIEEEIFITLKVWDGTGLIRAQFFNKNESEVHPGLSGFKYTGNRSLVRLFGLAKVFKKEKMFSGTKILLTDEKDFQLHTFEVIYSWLYLKGKKEGNNTEHSNKQITGDSQSLKGNSGFNSNSNLSSVLMTNQDSIVYENIKELSRINKKVMITDIVLRLSQKIPKDKVIDIIQNLCNNGYLIEEGPMVKLI